jgi:hypothetical protein
MAALGEGAIAGKVATRVGFGDVIELLSGHIRQIEGNFIIRHSRHLSITKLGPRRLDLLHSLAKRVAKPGSTHRSDRRSMTISDTPANFCKGIGSLGSQPPRTRATTTTKFRLMKR